MAFRYSVPDVEEEVEEMGFYVQENDSSSQQERIVKRRTPPAATTSKLAKPAAKPGAKKEAPLVLSSDSDMEELMVVDTSKGYEQSNGKGKGRAEQNEEEESDLDESNSKLKEEIISISNQIHALESLKASLVQQQRTESAASAVRSSSKSNPAHKKQKLSNQSRNSASGAIVDYRTVKKHSAQLKKVALETFGIKSFRFNQEAIANSILENRDVLAVLPTGAGKSLLFQLPALLSPGTTLVISPLLALMYDQVEGLRQKGIRAEFITGETSSADANAILKRMIGKGDGNEVKMIYKAYDAGKLSRVVIDEVHCVSTQSHDFRPSYKTLNLLKSLFPRAPILAITATASSNTVKDLLKILQLGPLTPGEAAESSGTVFFTAPLHRPNLVYSVIAKSNSDSQISEWILENHSNSTGIDKGIVYCFTRNDCEKVALQLRTESEGKILTGFYHADMESSERKRVHDRWRDGKIHVVCATIAFGLGIDAPTTDFVIHHTLSKSLDSYLQESGRAGRAGQRAHCVVFFRPADFTRLSGLSASEVGGGIRLRKMVNYALDFRTCRKFLFNAYFESLSDGSDSNAVEECGNCDNCTRAKSSFESKDVSMESFRALKIIEYVTKMGGTLTLAQAVDLIRGLGNGNQKRNGRVDVKEVAGGKVTLTKEDSEFLLLKLLIEGFLEEEYSQNGYNIISYLRTSRNALRFTRFTPNEATLSLSLKILLDLPAKVKKARKASLTKASTSKKSNKVVDVEADVEEEEVEMEDIEGWEGM